MNILSSTWFFTWSGKFFAPGNFSSIDIIPPIFFISTSWSRKSSRVNSSPFLNFWAIFSAFSWSTLRCKSSISDSTSPIPRIREATRSGWNGSNASVFSPTPRNLIGFPVIWRIDNAAPPRASPSTLVKMIPVNGKASLNALAVFAASWPVIASTVKSVSIGLSVAWSCLISSIISLSTCKRPAVSTINTSKKLSFACFNAASAISTGFCVVSVGKKSTFNASANVWSCLIAAGR